jgi:hypothetical protein
MVKHDSNIHCEEPSRMGMFLLGFFSAIPSLEDVSDFTSVRIMCNRLTLIYLCLLDIRCVPYLPQE